MTQALQSVLMCSNRGPASVAVAILLASLALSCSSTPQDPKILSTSTATSSDGMAISDEMMGRSRGQTALTRVATDPAYGYSKESSVKVGGGFGTGSERTYQYLNALRGPKGEAVHYIRIGTCCPFKSANSPFGDGLLEGVRADV
jgi:hypothetical protein